MHVNVAFKNFAPSEGLKEQVELRLAKLEKYINYAVEVHVILSLEKLTHRAEITCHAEHQQLFSECESGDMHESIDRAVHKLEAQLKKERDKRKGHVSASRALKDGKLDGDLKEVEEEIPHRGKR